MKHAKEHSYDWYQELFCNDLGLCNRQGQDWGGGNHDHSKIAEIAKYYLANPMFHPVGREMLVESLLESMIDYFDSNENMPQDCEAVVYEALKHAIYNVHDRDAARPYWDGRGPDQATGRLHSWLCSKFKEFNFPPSIWDR